MKLLSFSSQLPKKTDDRNVESEEQKAGPVLDWWVRKTRPRQQQ